MRKIMLLFMVLFFISCTTTKYVTIPLSKQPNFYEAPATNSVTSIKQLVEEYRRSIMKISEWQNWYVVQTNHGTNK